MIDRVLPTALTVSDLQRSLDFYCRLLGFEVATTLPPDAERERWDTYHRAVSRIPDSVIRVVYLQAPDGESHLELIEYLSPRRPAPARRSLAEPGGAIVALATSDSAGAVARLREAGVDVLSDPVPYETDGGERSLTTYLYDPDGNALCLFETLPPAE
jgi:catechol 2,3-dioxygenase-like lactoylglutathione lyase family enzyme